MKIIITRLISVFLIFLLLFNPNSLCFANTTDFNHDEILTLKENNIVGKSIPIVEEKTFDVWQAVGGWLLTIFVTLPISFLTGTIFLMPFVGLFQNSNIRVPMEIFYFASYLIYPLFNSLTVYFIGKNNKKASLGYTFFGAIVGTVFYFLLNMGLIIIESRFVSFDNKGPISNLQEPAFYLAMPLFVSFVATAFYHFNPDEKQNSITDEQIKQTELILERFTSKNGTLNYKILSF